MIVPKGCHTPAQDREDYCFTRRDLKFIKHRLDEIESMIRYYANMPENRTGDLFISGAANTDLYDQLLQQMQDIHDQFGDVLYDYRR